ncbi:MAG: hypothetical protein ACLPQS_09020 [Acidimicrobiales bacterium]
MTGEGRYSRRDEGSIAAFTVLLCAALVALLGLVAEGGQVLADRESAMAEAEQAARTGAAQLSPSTLHLGGIVDVGPEPAQAAEYVMAADGHRGVARAAGDVVTATVTPFSVSTPLLALVGIPSVSISAHASAKAVAS